MFVIREKLYAHPVYLGSVFTNGKDINAKGVASAFAVNKCLFGLQKNVVSRLQETKKKICSIKLSHIRYRYVVLKHEPFQTQKTSDSTQNIRKQNFKKDIRPGGEERRLTDEI